MPDVCPHGHIDVYADQPMRGHCNVCGRDVVRPLPASSDEADAWFEGKGHWSVDLHSLVREQRCGHTEFVTTMEDAYETCLNCGLRRLADLPF